MTGAEGLVAALSEEVGGGATSFRFHIYYAIPLYSRCHACPFDAAVHFLVLLQHSFRWSRLRL